MEARLGSENNAAVRCEWDDRVAGGYKARRALLGFHAASYYNDVSRSLVPTRAGTRRPRLPAHRLEARAHRPRHLGQLGRPLIPANWELRARNVGSGRQREPTFQLITPDLVYPTEYEAERECDSDLEDHQ